VAEKLAFSFNKSGDFTVVVLEGDSSGEKVRTEFKVWSVIMSSWSEYFDKMMSHEFEENTQRQVVIRDFSPKGIEVFLRFLYSGTLEASLETLVEVMVIADKYQVPELSSHCNELLRAHLSADTAWEIFKAADVFQFEQLREEAMHAILIEPKVALARRPAVNERLLQEVLSSDLLCVSDEDLFDLLVNWDDDAEYSQDVSRAKLIEKYVSMAKISDEKIRLMTGSIEEPERKRLKSLRSVCTRSEHTRDVIGCIRGRFDRWAANRFQGFRPGNLGEYFLSNWVHFVHSPNTNVGSMFALASCAEHSFQNAGSWVEWRLPLFAVKLLAVRFRKEVGKDIDLTVSCANDSSGWQQVLSSKDRPIKAQEVVPSRCEFLVKRFKVEICKGSFDPSDIRFEGILQERAS
ncbi:BTB/POZ domain-containing protein 1 (Hepatitis C virus NS5A-transactivated protein 8) (HCV NS5A-transactivated protein 8), partial [Durusdinium trenchii]